MKSKYTSFSILLFIVPFGILFLISLFTGRISSFKQKGWGSVLDDSLDLICENGITCQALGSLIYILIAYLNLSS